MGRDDAVKAAVVAIKKVIYPNELALWRKPAVNKATASNKKKVAKVIAAAARRQVIETPGA